MFISLNWLLCDSTLEGLTLHTCRDRQNVMISGVNIMDNPDTVQWIKPGELVLTTGYSILHDEDLQVNLLKMLKNAGCAALCLKTKRFFERYPDSMLQTAEEIGLPLVELPYQYSLADVVSEVNRGLYQTELRELSLEQKLFNDLFNSYFQNASLIEILQIIADYIGHSVLIINRQNQIPWVAPVEDDFPDGFNTSLLQSSFAHITDQTHEGKYYSGRLQTQGFEFRTASLPFSNQKYSFCILTPKPEDLPWDTLSHVLRIVDFSRKNNQFRVSNANDYYAAFFHYLMEPESFSELSAVQMFEYYGIPKEIPAVCLLINEGGPDGTDISSQTQRMIYECLKSTALSAHSFLAHRKNQFCLFLFRSDPLTASDMTEFLELLLRSVPGLLIGVSDLRPSDLPAAYQKSAFVCSLRKLFPDRNILFYQDYLTYWYISNLPEQKKRELYDMTIGPLVRYDSENNTELTYTLQVYFRCSCNSSLASKMLFIHRNTLLKRISKINSLIRFDPDNIDNQNSLYLGLCLYTLDRQNDCGRII